MCVCVGGGARNTPTLLKVEGMCTLGPRLLRPYMPFNKGDATLLCIINRVQTVSPQNFLENKNFSFDYFQPSCTILQRRHMIMTTLFI